MRCAGAEPAGADGAGCGSLAAQAAMGVTSIERTPMYIQTVNSPSRSSATVPPASPAASAPSQHRPCRGYSTACGNKRQQPDLNIARPKPPPNRPGGMIGPKRRWDALVVVACHIIELLVVRSLVHPILGGGVLHKRQILGANEASQPPECVVGCAATPVGQPGIVHVVPTAEQGCCAHESR